MEIIGLAHSAGNFATSSGAGNMVIRSLKMLYYNLAAFQLE
jgi:hypothetical protein